MLIKVFNKCCWNVLPAVLVLKVPDVKGCFFPLNHYEGTSHISDTHICHSGHIYYLYHIMWKILVISVISAIYTCHFRRVHHLCRATWKIMGVSVISTSIILGVSIICTMYQNISEYYNTYFLGDHFWYGWVCVVGTSLLEQFTKQSSQLK